MPVELPYFMLILSGVIIMAVTWQGKVAFAEMKKGKTPRKAKVLFYKKEQVPFRNDFTKIPYPYVELEGDESRPTRLKYAKSGHKPFKVGSYIDVFFYGGTLYYWHAYDKGLLKLFPSSWKFWKNEI